MLSCLHNTIKTVYIISFMSSILRPKIFHVDSCCHRQRKGWGPRNGDIKIVNNRMLRSESTNDHSSKEDNLDLQAPDMGVDKRLDKVDDVFRSSLASSSSVTPSMKHSREDLENVEDVKMDEDIVRNNFRKDDIATCTANDDGKENDENDLDDDVVSGHSVMQVNLLLL